MVGSRSSNQYTSNSSKLLQHPERLAEFRELGIARPITLDVEPTNACNLACNFCIVRDRDKSEALTYLQAKTCTEAYLEAGIKSIEISGGGEPTLWEHFSTYVRNLPRGLPLGLITNGLKLHELADDVINRFTWIRVSLNGVVDNGLEFKLEEYGVIETERSRIQNVLRDYDLPDDSWWPEDEREEEAHDYFGGEYISFIAFQDRSSVDISEIKEKIPENMRRN